MKWFHHECAAKHDPKLEILGASYRAEGLGIYWGLLEEIGLHSECFHLKVSGISSEADRKFEELCMNLSQSDQKLFGPELDPTRIPRLPLKILARVLYTTQSRLSAVLKTCVEVGLFDRQKWSEYAVLYSPGFEQRADDYTRRLTRQSETLRRQSGHSQETLRRESAKVSPDKNRTDENRQEGERDEKIMFADGMNKDDLSTFHSWSADVLSMIKAWNHERKGKFFWNPTEAELKKLLLGGEKAHMERLCLQAANLLGGEISYPGVVRRAVLLMLEASERTRITNPFGWLWTCLHGSGDGTPPWVQLMTAREEAARYLRKRPQSPASSLIPRISVSVDPDKSAFITDRDNEGE